MLKHVTWAVAVIVSALILASGGIEAQKAKDPDPMRIRFVGYTTDTFDANVFLPSLPSANLVCHANIPGSRVCEREELLLSIPAPPIDASLPCVLTSVRSSNVVLALQILDMLTGALNQCPSTGGDLTTVPIACCGF